MSEVFADAYYLLALVNPRDEAHAMAVEFSEKCADVVVTTEWVLTELGDGLSRQSDRKVFERVLDGLRSDPQTLTVPASHELFEDGVRLYNSRPDKEWSLTDCTSFVVMRHRGITAALTGDRHFEQAGFVALLGDAR